MGLLALAGGGPAAGLAQIGAADDDTGLRVSSGSRSVELKADAVCGQAPPNSGGALLPCATPVRPPRARLRPSGNRLTLEFEAPVRRVSWSAQSVRRGHVRQLMQPGRAQASEDPQVWTIDLAHQFGPARRRGKKPNAIQIVADYRDDVRRGGSPVAEATSTYELRVDR